MLKSLERGSAEREIRPPAPNPKYPAEVAQLVEQLIRNQQVVGSTPILGSVKSRGYGFQP